MNRKPPIASRLWPGLVALAVLLVGELARPTDGWSLRVEDRRSGEVLFDGPDAPPAGRAFSSTNRLRYSGHLFLRDSGFTLFGVRAQSGNVSFAVGGKSPPVTPLDPEWAMLGALELEAGWHAVELSFEPEGAGMHELAVAWSRSSPDLLPIPIEATVPETTPSWWFAVGAWTRPLAVCFGLLLAGRCFPRLARRLAAVVAGIAAALALFEVGLRVADVRPADRIRANLWFEDSEPLPGSTTTYVGSVVSLVREFEVEVRLNESGWRERDYPRAKAPGTRRIVILGDSYIEGKEVPFEATVHEQLEAELSASGGSAYEVLAFARGGFGTLDELAVLRDEALAYDPDLVLVGFFPGNDVCDNSQPLANRRRAWKELVYYRRVVPARLDFLDRFVVCEASRLNRVLADRLVGPYLEHLHDFGDDLHADALRSPALDVYRHENLEPAWSEAWRITEAALLEMRELARGAGAELAVVVLPGGDRRELPDDASFDPDWPARRTREFCRANEIPVLDLGPDFAEHERVTGEPLTWRFDAHWNETGHRVAAERLARFVLEGEAESGR